MISQRHRAWQVIKATFRDAAKTRIKDLPKGNTTNRAEELVVVGCRKEERQSKWEDWERHPHDKGY